MPRGVIGDYTAVALWISLLIILCSSCRHASESQEANRVSSESCLVNTQIDNDTIAHCEQLRTRDEAMWVKSAIELSLHRSAATDSYVYQFIHSTSPSEKMGAYMYAHFCGDNRLLEYAKSDAHSTAPVAVMQNPIRDNPTLGDVAKYYFYHNTK